MCFCLLCRFRFGTISKTYLTWGNWRYCTVSVFYISTWENGRPLQITFYYLRICHTNCLTCATCNLLNMEGTSLISLIWTKLKSILGFDVSAILVITQMKVHWFWCVLVGFDVVLCYFLLILVKILMHFLCVFYALLKRASKVHTLF